jgi:hypothetical protein
MTPWLCTWLLPERKVTSTPVRRRRNGRAVLSRMPSLVRSARLRIGSRMPSKRTWTTRACPFSSPTASPISSASGADSAVNSMPSATAAGVSDWRRVTRPGELAAAAGQRDLTDHLGADGAGLERLDEHARAAQVDGAALERAASIRRMDSYARRVRDPLLPLLVRCLHH